LNYLERGLIDGIRADGRSRLDYRYFSIESSVIEAANGSASVTLGGTRVIVTVKLELLSDNDSENFNDFINCSVDCLANISSEFDNSVYQTICSSLTSVMNNLYVNNKCIDKKILSLDNGNSHWRVNIEALILESAGNEIDAISWAVKAALMATKIPKIDVIKPIDTDSKQPAKLLLVDDESLAIPFPADNLPISVTFSSINNILFIDCQSEEELVAETSSIIGIDRSGSIICVNHRGSIGLNRSNIEIRLSKAREIGKTLHLLIESKLSNNSIK